MPIPGPLGDDFVASGEQPAKALQVAVANALKDMERARRGQLAKVPFKPKLDANVPAPDGAGVSGQGDRGRATMPALTGDTRLGDTRGFLFIADSTNNRIVQATLPDEGAERTDHGVRWARPGLVDGAPGKARFRDPQGLAFDRARRTCCMSRTPRTTRSAINLKTKETELIVGDGKQEVPLRHSESWF